MEEIVSNDNGEDYFDKDKELSKAFSDLASMRGYDSELTEEFVQEALRLVRDFEEKIKLDKQQSQFTPTSASALAALVLEENLRKGKTISFPSLGIEIERSEHSLEK